MYEKQFLREMMKAMRSTVTSSELLPVSPGERIYREELDNEYAEKWGDAGGIGLSGMIFEQLKQKFGPLLGAPVSPPGPGPQEGPKPADQLFLKIGAAGAITEGLRTPLGGEVVGKYETPETANQNDQLTHLTIDHGSLRSKWTFQGKSDLQIGDKTFADSKLARLVPTAKEFLVHWARTEES